MKKKIITAVAVFLIFCIPFALIAYAGFLLPSVYVGTFMGQLAPMFERLCDKDENKIIIIGGSSIPFGVDASLLSRTVGMPVVNFGLYAALGTQAMLDLSEEEINKGDIVIIAPEENAETYSMFFGAEAMWQGTDGNFQILKNLDGNTDEMLGTFWSFAYSKFKYRNTDITPSGIYKNASFDEYGYISAERPYNIMNESFDSNMKINLTEELFSKDFIAYLNEYTDKLTERGAKVYFSFAPMNENALDESMTMETLEAFIEFIKSEIHAELLSSPNDYIYRSGYFYDSNFHLNSSGAILHTRTLALDIAKILPDITVDIDVPDEPEKPEEPVEQPPEYDENEKYFVFKKTSNGYAITGISKLGKEQTVLTTPVGYEGEFVRSIYTDSFSDCPKLSELFITANIIQITDYAFSGAPSLKTVHLLFDSPDKCTVNSMLDTLTPGMHPNVKFFVKQGLLHDFRANYFWGIYGDYLAEENR